MAPNTGTLLLQRTEGEAYYYYTDLAATDQVWLPDHWYRMEVTWGQYGTIVGRLYDSDGTTLLNELSGTDTTISSGGIAFRGFGAVKHFDTVGFPADVDFYQITVPAADVRPEAHFDHRHADGWQRGVPQRAESKAEAL